MGSLESALRPPLSYSLKSAHDTLAASTLSTLQIYLSSPTTPQQGTMPADSKMDIGKKEVLHLRREQNLENYVRRLTG